MKKQKNKMQELFEHYLNVPFENNDEPSEFDQEVEQALEKYEALYKKLREKLSPAERQIIELLEKSKGRKLSQQEINLALDQAREVGEL